MINFLFLILNNIKNTNMEKINLIRIKLLEFFTKFLFLLFLKVFYQNINREDRSVFNEKNGSGFNLFNICNLFVDDCYIIDHSVYIISIRR